MRNVACRFSTTRRRSVFKRLAAAAQDADPGARAAVEAGEKALVLGPVFDPRHVARIEERLQQAQRLKAIGTLAGPLHGGANQRVVQMLEEIGRPENAKTWMEKQLAANKVIWGMGHREYKTKDPRATVLQKLMVEWAESHGKLSKQFETALALEEVCEEALGPKGVYPNVDYYSGILYTDLCGIACRRLVGPLA